jgi:hypothetical protein
LASQKSTSLLDKAAERNEGERAMKKTFPLESAGHAPARVIESIRNDIRKYLKRERHKPLSEGVDFWDFDCRIGSDADVAVAFHVMEIADAIDRVAATGAKSVYVEILAKPGQRAPRAEGSAGGTGENVTEDNFNG